MLLGNDTTEFGGKNGRKVIRSEDLDLHLIPIRVIWRKRPPSCQSYLNYKMAVMPALYNPWADDVRSKWSCMILHYLSIIITTSRCYHHHFTAESSTKKNCFAQSHLAANSKNSIPTQVIQLQVQGSILQSGEENGHPHPSFSVSVTIRQTTLLLYLNESLAGSVGSLDYQRHHQRGERRETCAWDTPCVHKAKTTVFIGVLNAMYIICFQSPSLLYSVDLVNWTVYTWTLVLSSMLNLIVNSEWNLKNIYSP